MRIKTIMTACLAVPALSVLCLLSSCSSEELPTTEKPSTGPQTLTLNLTPAGTRAAVYADPTNALENKINSVTIGIFGSDNNVKTIQEVTTTSNKPTITTSQLDINDQVLVAVNARSGTFTGAKTVTEFEDKTLAIDDALAGSVGSATTVASDKLPMFGTGVIKVGETSTSFEADVSVYHMVAKITLKSLNVNFSTTGAYKDAVFTPTEVFMSNVPDKLDFYPVIDANMTSYSKFATYGNLCQGESNIPTNLKAYLGTGAPITGFSPDNSALKGDNTGSYYKWKTTDNILFLYTMPNAATATPTRLVIKGTFNLDGKDANPPTVYYPVNINYNSAGNTVPDGGTMKQVYPNKNYIIDVTIQGKGSSDANTSIDPETATANITVKDFTTANQSNVFN